jgi:hypothetical protein
MMDYSPPSRAKRSNRSVALGIVGTLFLVAGIIAVVLSYQDHSVCDSLLGELARGASSRTADKCNEYDAAFYGGIAGGIVGLVLVVVAIALPSGARSPIPYGPDWYPDPRKPGSDRWWDGTQWTVHTRSRPWRWPLTVFLGVCLGLALLILIMFTLP